MIIALIIAFLITVISFTLGVMFTLFFSKSDTYDRVVERLPKKEKEPVIGVIERPDARTVNKTTLEEETEEEMAKVLRKAYPKK